ncbi:phenylacetaldoxime dehydratase family protein [Pseudomonas sp. NPDC089752]|uniref:phenylacetaldoxime dehydratase family protein n=1 Tax=Pseudomonas sp. NPDC089752 TaxID=3364472 RepID=UPI0037F6BA5B
MSESDEAKESTARIAIFPKAQGSVAVAIIGVQHLIVSLAQHSASHLSNLLSKAAAAPGSLERFSYTDSQGYHNEVFMAYWLHEADYQTWLKSEAVSSWISQLGLQDTDVGIWLEVMTPPIDQYQYGAPVVQKDGLATLGELAKSEKFGYWGGYRDRVPASAYDKFESPLDSMPDRKLKSTKGKRLTLQIPDNVCFIREGQDWSRAGDEERAVWRETMDEVVKSWTGILVERSGDSGTFNLRSMQNIDPINNSTLDKQTQVAFLLSLSGIEKAARTWKEHLQVHASLIKMFREAKFKPTMNIWAEMFILKSQDFSPIYINCHSETGLLPYFDVTEI